MNSYAAVAEADDFFAARYGAEAWAALDNTVKESLLITATNVLDTFTYGGLRTVRTQPLKWPRQLIYTDEGQLLSALSVPTQVKAALFEMAYWKWTEDERPATDAELQQLKASKVGPLDYTFKEGVALIPAIVLNLIRGIGPGTLISAPGSKSSVSSLTL
jgi:hypothetical protein